MPKDDKIVKTKLFEDETENAINLIAAMTGESVNKLSIMKPDEIISLLSYLLKCNKEETKKILRHNNQNQNLDFVSLLKLWRLVNFGVIKKSKGINGIEEKVHENIEFQTFRRNERTAINPTLRLGRVSAIMFDNNLYNLAQPKVSIDRVGDWRLKAFINNINQFHSIKPGSF